MKYQILNADDVIKEGDEKTNTKTGRFRKIHRAFYGMTCERINPFSKYRRPITDKTN